MIHPGWFWPILFLDVWMLGYTHVVSTFTRLAFDRQSFLQHRFLLLPLPIVVAACTIGVAMVAGEWLIATVYLYAQWFHYTRQSYGISRMYLRKAGAVFSVARFRSRRRDLCGAAVGHSVSFVSEPNRVPEPRCALYSRAAPPGIVVGAVATVSVLLWLAREIRSFSLRRADLPDTAYMLSHIAIFGTGYLLIDDINTGWLVLNIWHNLQYMLIVWMFNVGRFGDGIDPRRRLLSTIASRRTSRSTRSCAGRSAPCLDSTSIGR